MKPEQFIREFGVEKAREVVECAPEGSEFYHKDNNEYVKNIDQEHLEKAQAEPKESHLVNFDSSSSEGWVENAAWIEYINVLIDLSDLNRLVESIDLVESWGGIEDLKLYDLSHCKNKPESAGYKLLQAIADYESIYGGGDE
ncbi:TPA: hypothetical protein JI136_07765 [Acinetobacter baumannii]|nr:hypothetical protein [Acinetobacter baumannii]HAV5726337.1 hypothetical protein [Acinetobacter baumannii]HAV5728903.1 hypothetical protein [Acinetobacter baumannii]